MIISISAFGETEMSRELLRWSFAAYDMRPAFDRIHDSFTRREIYQFSTQGGLSGGWAPLAASTVAYKARAGLDPRILVATGKLKNSLTRKGNENHVYTVTPDSMFIGSSVEYGKFHQSRAERHKLPRRPVVVLDDATRRNWVKILQTWLAAGSGGAV